MCVVSVECYDHYGYCNYEFEVDIEDFQYQQLLFQVNDDFYSSLIFKNEEGKIIARCGPANVTKIEIRAGNDGTTRA